MNNENDIEYLIFKFISREADNYVPLGKLLEDNGLDFQTALAKSDLYRKHFFELLEKYRICTQNVRTICTDLMKLIEQNTKDKNLHYLYCAAVTDCGLIFDTDRKNRTSEQNIRCYLKQNKNVTELMDFLDKQSGMRIRFGELLKAVRKNVRNVCENKSDYTEEQSDIFQLSIQYEFLYESKNSKIYYDNICELIRQINTSQELRKVKPYIIFAVLSRKHNMIQKRINYTPNLGNVFNYQQYNILRDNGKNFDTYQSYIELYYNLREYYNDEYDTDISFSDYCFANTSTLSEWYYTYCEPDEDIPMTAERKFRNFRTSYFCLITDTCDDDSEEPFSEKILSLCRYIV